MQKQTMHTPIQSSQHYKILAILLTLYFAQGLPAGFITQALAWCWDF
ncbi:hypothetical protein ACGTJS_09180 [Faucicola mancuniensis]|nr:hypothetical protein [uncultured Moraxella sp.]